jgi:hypothetical protein
MRIYGGVRPRKSIFEDGQIGYFGAQESLTIIRVLNPTIRYSLMHWEKNQVSMDSKADL